MHRCHKFLTIELQIILHDALEKTVANLTLDILQTAGPARI